MYICTYVHMYIYICIHVYMYRLRMYIQPRCVFGCFFLCVSVCLLVCLFVCVCVLIVCLLVCLFVYLLSCLFGFCCLFLSFIHYVLIRFMGVCATPPRPDPLPDPPRHVPPTRSTKNSIFTKKFYTKPNKSQPASTGEKMHGF